MPDAAAGAPAGASARRWLYLFLVSASTAAAVTQLHGILAVDGLSIRETVILILFAVLFAWIAASFWLTVFGAAAVAMKTPLLPLRPAGGVSAARTAILMPVYNEDVDKVFSGLRAIWESVKHTPDAPDFDFYILSDSTNPAAWVAEELEWQRLKDTLETQNIFYRHRTRNTGRKAGNIQDFCENWGQLYDYMVILDADSLMTGAALAQLVGLMDANPRAGLIQAPPGLVGRHSLFARLQQFASSVYGPVHAAGLAVLQSCDGNYWGHNAIIRVHAFMQYCGLPSLPGVPPFGGEIMSHDFVEAALLRRAGWEVWMAPAITGSFEEPPPTIADHLLRDRRWCQGNLQHLRIVFARGLTLPSRLHIALGIMSYLASPLWLLLLVVSATEMLSFHAVPAASFIGQQPSLPLAVSHAGELGVLVAATLVLLFGPKLLAVAMMLRDPQATRDHGGTAALVRSVLAESVFSTLFAPIVMLQHSWYVVTIVLGLAGGWNAQARSDRALPLLFVVERFGLHSVIGIAATVLLWNSSSFGWYVPLLAGLWLAVPLVLATSSPLLGRTLRHEGLFLVPSETRGLAVLDRAHALAALPSGLPQDTRLSVLNDARVRDLHLALLPPMPEKSDRARLDGLVQKAARRDTAAFSREDWSLLLSDAESLRTLGTPLRTG